MRDPVQLLALIAIVAIGTVLLWRYAVGIVLIVLAIAIGLDCLMLGKEGMDVGINVYVDDVACVVLLSAGVLVAWRKGRFPDSSSWPAFTLFALMAVNLDRGVSEFGWKPAGNGARNLLYLIVPSVALLLLRPALRVNPQRLANLLAGFGSALTAIALCRWAGVLSIPLVAPDDVVREFREVVRTLGADDALVIGQSLLAIVCLQLIDGVKLWRTCLAAILAATTVALQHRSVWVSTCVGLMWLAASSLRSSEKRWRQLAGSTFIGLTVAAGAVSSTGTAGDVVSLITANIDETQRQNSTWSWRVNGFLEATDRLFSSGTFEMLLGPPSGRDLGSSGSFASVHIHNRYVVMLAYYGVLGGLVLLLWLFAVGRKVGGWIRTHPGGGPEMHAGTAFLQALLLSQLTYFVVYTGGIVQGGITALIWLAAESRAGRIAPIVAPGYSYLAARGLPQRS